MGICFLEKNAIEYQKYLSFLLSKPNYFIQFAMGYPVLSLDKMDFAEILIDNNTVKKYIMDDHAADIVHTLNWRGVVLILWVFGKSSLASALFL